MSMTTLLTLAGMFGGLSSVTPPISYVTKLDVWMVVCIIFVFLTLAEFTVVIFLKYYLNNLPIVNLQKIFDTTHGSSSIPSRSTSAVNDMNKEAESPSIHTISTFLDRTINLLEERNNREIGTDDFATRRVRKQPRSLRKSQVGRQRKNTTKLPVVTDIIDDDATDDEDDVLEERRVMSEKIIKRIEKYSVIVFFLCFFCLPSF